MDRHEEQIEHVKRVVLPSGKTIEVVYFKEAEELLGRMAPPTEPLPTAEPDQDLHVCLNCDSRLVNPVEWEEAGPDSWRVLLGCPDCDVHREGVFSQAAVEAFDEELDRGADALVRDYKRLMRANLAEEIDRFAEALEADAILPEDF
jgi:hypothetical protein